MFSICGICREQLVRRNGSSSSEAVHDNREEKFLVSTTCGHLFHSTCLQHWFQVEDESGAPWKSCPYCKKIFDESGTGRSNKPQPEGYHRIFPVSLDEVASGESGDDQEGENSNATTTVDCNEPKEIMMGLLKKMHLMEIEMRGLKKSHRGNIKSNSWNFVNSGIGENVAAYNTRSLRTSELKNIALADSNAEQDGNHCDIPRTMSSASAQELMKKSIPTSGRGRGNPELKLGDRVLYRSTSVFAGPMPFAGVVKSLHLNRHGRTIAGVAFEKKIPHGMSPLFFIRQYIDARPKNYRLIEDSRLVKIDHRR